MTRRHFVAAGLGLGLSSLAPLRAWAQRAPDAYPNRPVRLLVGYPPGGLPDTTARIVAQRLSDSLGQQFVIDNRPGAGGALACEAAAKSLPDGYTLVIVDLGQSAINMALYPKLPYDTLRDFTPVSLLGTSPFFLAAHAGSGINSFQDLVRMAKEKPGSVSYGSSGNGSPPHLAMEILKKSAGLDILHVPFKGSGQSLPALMGGQVQLLFTVLPTVSAAVKSGSVRLLGLASDARTPQAPDVPTFEEMGVKGMRVLPSVGILAPAATPRPIVSALAAEVAKAVRHPDTLQRFSTMGIDPVGNTPEQYAVVLKDDISYYAAAVKATGAKID
ncbi:MAG TPA: tripartite tricarboxylate transporter substrate binding protein [Ramlibacter sp.]|nr:tripartite tricarboxylate transporter substrate binding protein [Ramlibacter sp.]